LHETALIEAFNLKAAIEYVLKNVEASREALTDMPPRSEDELDAVTLHNQVCASFFPHKKVVIQKILKEGCDSEKIKRRL